MLDKLCPYELNTLIANVIYGFFIFLLLICFIQITVKGLVHGSTKKERIKTVETLDLSASELECARDQISRTYVYSFCYGIHTSIYLLCSTMSIVCSVGSLAMLPLSSGLCWQNLSVSITAVIFVFITIYAKPAKRSSQYLTAWIEAETDTLTYLTKLGGMRSKSNDAPRAYSKEIEECNIELVQKRKEIEYSITSDFDDN